jgi:hypothetical protein
MFPDIKLGIEPNKGDNPPSMDEMRRAIDHASRHSHLIRGALDAARYRGLSGEDTYVLLAYHALVTLEDTHKRLMKMVSLTPMPSIIMKESDVPPDLRR